MISEYKVITVTHKSASLKETGAFVITPANDESLSEKIQNIKKSLYLKEMFYVATCNRVLFFFHTQQDLDNAFLSQFHQTIYPHLDFEFCKDKFICYTGDEALNHLFKVASSVDSLVVGEREIIRQLREAYEYFKNKELIGDNIRLAFDTTVRTAKQVYAQTRIGEKPVSVVSLAIKKLLNTDIPKSSKIIVIGAGQTNELFCKFLAKHNFNNVTIFNRTLEKAEQLAQIVKGTAMPLSELKNYKKGFDVMVVCTAVTQAIIQKENYTQLINNCPNQKIIVDLGIPHNVDQKVIEKFNTHYIEIEGLKKLAENNLAFRANEVENAKKIIYHSLMEFDNLYKERQLERAFSQMPQQIKEIKTKAFEEVFKKDVDNLDEETKELLHKMMNYMEKKCIGIPMKVAKQTILP